MAITLGRTGLAVSPITFGTWQLSGHWGAFDEDEAVAAVRHARELGVTIFDTAHAYGWGRAEKILGRALRDDLTHRREDVVIVTKGGLRISDAGAPFPDSSAAFLRMGIENSLRSLGVDYLDVYLVHAPDSRVAFADTAELLGQYVTAGTIRHVGVSNHSATQIAEFAATTPVEVAESPYNLFRRGIADDLLPYTRTNDIGTLAYSPLANGLLSGALAEDTTFAPDDWRSGAPMFHGERYRRALGTVARLRHLAQHEFGVPLARLAVAWALAHPAVDSVIVGTHRAKHIQEAVEAVGLRLSEQDLTAIDRGMADPAGQS